MKNRRAKKIVTAGMGVLMAASSVNAGSLQIVSAQENVVQQSTSVISPLMISELVADTHQSDQTTASGTDAFEYIEIYNTSDQPVSMDDYRIRYVNGSTLTDWEIPQGTIIQPKEAIVIWVQNEESVKSDEETFRAYYGIENPDVRIIQTLGQVNGFSNSGERSMQIVVKNTGQIVNAITYNDGTEKAQTKKGIRFAYQSAQVQEQTLAYDGTPTPGVLEADQQLDGTYTIPGAGDASIQAVSSDRITAGESLVISALWELDSVVTNAYVQSADASKTYAMTYADGVFTAVIPAADLLDTETFAYTVHMSDGVNQLRSETNSVLIDAGDTTIAYASPLLLTEVVPNTDNVGGSDAYEYFEIYNVSGFDIDLSDYHFLYDNGSTVAEWQLEDAITLKAKETLTVWVRNDAVVEAGLTAEDFNTHYGSSLTQGEQLTSVRSDGFSNSGTRTMQIVSPVGRVLNTLRYTAEDSGDGSIGVDEAIQMDYLTAEGTLRYDAQPSVHQIEEGQVPHAYDAPAMVEDPQVTVSAPSVMSAQDRFDVRVESSDLERVLSADLQVYDGTTLIDSLPMTDADGVLQATIDYDTVKDLDAFTYVVTLSNGVQEASCTSASIPVENTAVDTTDAPALVVTEIIPDTSNTNGADAYEYIEIYNNSDQDIDLKDYKLYYNYPDSGSDSVWWESDESRILPAHETLVFWIKNGGNDDLTLADFNQKWGTQLTSDQVIEIECGGMANSGARGVKIASNVKDVIDVVTYNMNGADNTTADRSISFQNRYANGAFGSVLVEDADTPTPGTVTEAQRPVYEATLPQEEDVQAPIIEDLSPSTFNDDEELRLSLRAQSEQTTIKTVRLYIKDNLSQDYMVYNLLRNDGDVFSYTLPAVDLFGKSSYTYYFEVSDGYQSVRSDVRSIDNEETIAVGDGLNIAEGALLSGIHQIIGTGADLQIDGQPVETNTSIQNSAKIAFDASQTDVFFKNAVAIGDEALGVFNEGTYDTWTTYAYDVDAAYFDADSQEITIAFHAGNKANALEHDIENNDDFVLKNIRLLLPDGTTLRPQSYAGVNGIGAIEHTADNWHPQDPQALRTYGAEDEISMGDGTTKIEILYVTFAVPETSFNGKSYLLDTTMLSDGTHTISSGTASVQVTVDNTAPEIETNLTDGTMVRNETIRASAQDAISGEVAVTAMLDGEAITLPYTFDSTTLSAGTHTLTLTAADTAGNLATKTVTFTTPQENAVISDLTPGSGSIINGDPTLSAFVTDPTNDRMEVSFKLGEHYSLGDANITSESGIAQNNGSTEGSFTADSGDGFPYEVFDIDLSASQLQAGRMKVRWSGVTNNDKTFLYAYNRTNGTWDRLESEAVNENGELTLTADLTLDDYVQDQQVRIMVQNGEGYTPPQYSAGEAGANATYNVNDTPRDDYDFTFVIESDTQYYNEDYDGNPSQDVDGQYQYQLDIHNWVLNNRERMNIQYMFHDGDIIDDEPLIPEWENADRAYQMLDDADLPYGVLAGNHDVGHLSGDYTNYSKYFGESRYQGNPWYGGSYKDNRGHYDLITVDGIDFIMIYMGWGIGDEEIAWMNEVLAQYPERKAILNFHEYLLASGGLGEEPQRIYDEVVATNPNVCMVFSGHYHNAQTRVDRFDDDGDGVAERNVYQMLFDYQGLAQGGMGYIRLLHFDMDNEQIIFRTYSPSLNDYDAKDEENIGDVDGINGEERFTVSFADLGITAKQKQLTTSSLDVDLYSEESLATIEDVRSGTKVEYTLEHALNGTFGWYVEVRDANGGYAKSDVQYVTVQKDVTLPTLILPSDNTLQLNDAFDAMAGVRATDYTGADITDRVQVSGSVDTTKAGTYVLTYTVTDAYGNQVSSQRVITVEDAQENDPSQGGENEPTRPGSGETNDTPSAPQDDAQQTGSDASSADTATVQNDATVYAGTGILAAIAAAFILLRKKMGRAERH